MNHVKREFVEAKDEGPQLHIVTASDGAGKRISLSAPLVLPSRIHARRPRPELAILGWSHRAIRLAYRKQDRNLL
jgi:hypothetical protein